MDIIEEATFDTKFNQVKHTVELYLDSGDGASSSNIFPINPNAVVNFSIEETLANWVTKGSLTFFYSPELAGGYMNSNLGQVGSAAPNIGSSDGKSFYQFRGDGNDKLRLRIVPDVTNSQNNSISISQDDKHWCLSYLFSIYDMEDIDELPGAQNQGSSVLKCLKIYFWDEWYQKMITNIIEYSTAVSNTQQKKPTGDAMQEIIEKALLDVPSTLGMPTGSVASGDWERGAAEIFFTAPAQTNAYECLMYVYDKHLSDRSLPGSGATEVFDFSLLVKERGREAKDVGYLTLKPLSHYFERAGKSADSPGEYQFEHFFLQSYADSSKRPKAYRAPMGGGDKSGKVDFNSLKYGAITSYRFVDISALTNSTEFVNTPVYSFDFATRLYQVEFKTPSVQTARQFISKQYIDQLYKAGADPEKLFLINLHTDKQKNKNLKPTFSLYGDDPIIRQADGIQKLIYLGVFQNTCIHFRTLGLTTRRPGSFIAIDKTDGVDPGDFQDKFYGQWFVINVKHVFETEVFYNEITAVKVHRFDVPQIKFPNTF
jgi:hypothetical protein